MNIKTSRAIGPPWSCFFPSFLWQVWKRRNDFVFTGECLPLSDIYRIGIVWASHFADSISDVSVATHATDDFVQWVAPAHDWVCLNTDASVSLPDHLGSLGGVLRGSSGDWLRGYRQLVGVVPPLNAELWSILVGLQLAFSMGFSRVQVQSDSSAAIRLILDPMAANSVSSLVRRISSLQNLPWLLRFLWVPREMNMVADGLSKLPSLNDFHLQIFDDKPETIRPLQLHFVVSPLVLHLFVSNLPGSSMLEVFALLNNVALLTLLRYTFCSQAVNDASRYLKSYLASLALDYVFIVLPTLLIFTVLSEWLYECTVGLFLLTILSSVLKRTYNLPYTEGHNAVRASISTYRVVTMFVTCLCILAVDFRIYPREFAKTETYGTGLMDLGVGSFVLMNAVTSRQARNISSPMSRWKAAFRSTIPLLLLGFARLVSTLSLDYQVHVGEYGVNWNFFFTLAGVSILTSIINVPAKYSGILGAAILVGYQSWLSNGLSVYLLSNERGMDIISRNKEGIFSLFGYWGMYLIGVQKIDCMERELIFVTSVCGRILTLLIDRHVERISRRMCNLAYVIWVTAQNLQLLAWRFLADNVVGSKVLALERAFDRNLLASFLVANLLTGLVNLSVDTIFVSAAGAVLILIIQQLPTKQPDLQSRRNVLRQIAAKNRIPLQLEEAIISSEGLADAAFESTAHAAAATRAVVELSRDNENHGSQAEELNWSKKTPEINMSSPSSECSAEGIIDLRITSTDEMDPIQLLEKEVVTYVRFKF
ncbi:hypothetical protein V6N12_069186 [Hibiscus sabdariffa]|uniref:RNase H type-1 domain-containing protein n=1 Tax=Hibiscus sabdariffa TaxID=183260 RepID=A0ABR2FD88_9ROSI